MTATNGWPGKPGVPMNPDRSGAHILGSHVLIWRASIGDYINGNGNVMPPEVACAWPYRGPCLTPDEVAALQARVAELEGALKAYPRFTEILMTSQQKRIFILEAALADMIAVATECAGLAGQALNSKYLEKIQNAEKIIVKFVSGGKDE